MPPVVNIAHSIYCSCACIMYMENSYVVMIVMLVLSNGDVFSIVLEREIAYVHIVYMVLSSIFVNLIEAIHPLYVRFELFSIHNDYRDTVYPKKYAHGFVVLCFVVLMQLFIMNSHEVFIHVHQGCFAGTGTIVRLPQCQWSRPDGYGKISQCITTTKHSKAKPCAYFLGYTVWSLHTNPLTNVFWCSIHYIPT